MTTKEIIAEMMTGEIDTSVLLPVPDTLPTIVCLCGSTKFLAEYKECTIQETLKGNIVLSIGVDMKTDTEYFEELNQLEINDIKDDLDLLHLYKIILADEILVINKDGYVGTSTAREIAFATKIGKHVRYLEGK